MKKKIAILSIIISASLLCGLFAVWAVAQSDPNAPQKSDDVSGTLDQIGVVSPATEEFKSTLKADPYWNIVAESYDLEQSAVALSDEQNRQLEALREKSGGLVGRLIYQEMAVLGEVDVSQPKLDLETARKIIAQNTDFYAILDEFIQIQPYPDYYGGSGCTPIEYWLDQDGEYRILITLEGSRIDYVHVSGEFGENLLDYEVLFGNAD